MDPFIRPTNQQGTKPLTSTIPTLLDERSHQWVLARGMDRPPDNPLQSYNPQPWSDSLYQGDSSTGARLHPFQSSNSGYQPDAYYSRPSNPRFPGQLSMEGSSLQFPIDLSGNSMVNPQNQSLPPLMLGATQSRKGKRNIYSKKEWDLQLPRIRQLYMEDDLTLDATMARMTAEHNFSPSERAYKNKFEELGWRKKLPLATAQFIVNKQQERRGMLTDFILYDNPISLEKAEETIRRGKGGGNISPGNALMQTPTGLKYHTPPGHTAKDPTPDLSNPIHPRLWTPLSDVRTPFPSYLPLVWRGNRFDDVAAMSREAKECEQLGNMETAERKYREALSGYERLLSPTHHDTLELGYQLAGFYAKQNRMLQADEVLDWMNRKVVGHWGLTNESSIAHFLRITNLYRSWSREEDATILMHRLVEASKYSISDSLESSKLQDAPPSIQSMLKGRHDAIPILESAEDNDVANADQRLRLAKAQLTNSPSEVKGLALDLMKRCEQNLPGLSVQLLKAACVLVKAAQAADDEEQTQEVLSNAAEACFTVLQHREENKRAVLEAAIEIVDLHVETEDAESEQSAEQILELISTQAERVFGVDGRETVFILIQIGLMYQSNGRWNKAKAWFEQAMSASMTQFCCHHPLTRILETALEEKYLSDQLVMTPDMALLSKCPCS